MQSVIEKSELRRIPSLSSTSGSSGTPGGGGVGSGTGSHQQQQKKCGVSGESCSWNVSHCSTEDEVYYSTDSLSPGGKAGTVSQTQTQPLLEEPQRFHKDFRTRQLIRAALGDNDFLQNLDREQIRDMVDFMYPQTFAPGDFVIREGEVGTRCGQSKKCQ